MDNLDKLAALLDRYDSAETEAEKAHAARLTLDFLIMANANITFTEIEEVYEPMERRVDLDGRERFERKGARDGRQDTYHRAKHAA